MSNHPKDLNIHASAGPPVRILSTSDTENNGLSTMVPEMQDIPTFGIAGRIWNSAYVLDVFLRRPSDLYTFTPPCPIPPEYFLNTAELNGEQQPPLDPIRIIELGAGTGYAGIALAERLSLACTLVLTDLEEVVPLLKKNVQVSSARYKEFNGDISDLTVSTASTTAVQQPSAILKIEPLAWGNSSHSNAIISQGKVDYVVASDVTYFPELYPQLLQTLRDIADLDTKIIIVYEERAQWKEASFWEQFGRFFEIEVVRIKNQKGRNGVEEDDKDKDEEEDSGYEDSVEIYGSEQDIYVFVAKKRRDKDILAGVDDTFATLSMMQIRC
ncbi:hypothetical protein BGZ99_008993 [Dissophora globulifera]|uniref:Methyltransferase-domain-containing protein n=1 Tax=Dissophora globulifera TaxID=979702 RepID=A0A9P6RVF8_9FUNG|nr:hypothetical protein BGZ99_008993 [Dissophora globulifera]